jgi:hypothetical protein
VLAGVGSWAGADVWCPVRRELLDLVRRLAAGAAGAGGAEHPVAKLAFKGAGVRYPDGSVQLGNPNSDAYKLGYAFGLGALAFAPGAEEEADAPEVFAGVGKGLSHDGEIPGLRCFAGSSFAPGTKVLVASGAAVPISQLRPGDKVLATSTATGTTQPEAVTAVLVHHDTDLYNLTVETSRGTAVIHTTASHLFWDPYPHYGWIPAKHLKPGMHLKTPNGQAAVVVGGSVPAVHDGWMWDLTVPGNNDHDF